MPSRRMWMGVFVVAVLASAASADAYPPPRSPLAPGRVDPPRPKDVNVVNTPNVNVVNSPTVTVGNTATNPVPVQSSQKTTVIAMFTADVPSNGNRTAIGSVDVSAYSQIRVVGDPAGVGDYTATFILYTVAPDGTHFVLDQTVLSAIGTVPDYDKSFDIPGTTLEIWMTLTCNGGGCTSQPVKFFVFGR